ncbi:hypothetical protein CASFOL_019922 [Castilleja foliolosa]|uniref:Uncharacterized protein n=1 Tax=Castilleja foliolosa TaxID=1961234 RepID=A0ABD3CZD1_9LAMI
MSAPPMDPFYEQRLRDEVIYLHSLWHQGPPRPAAAPPSLHSLRHQNPPRPTAPASFHLQPSQATQFKKKNKKKPKKKPNNTAPEPNSSPGLEWAVFAPPPSPPADIWPSSEAKPDPKPVTLSAKDQSISAVKHAHQHALKTVADFFKYNNANDDSDSDSIEGISDEDGESMDEDGGESEEYKLFSDVFNLDNELSNYYVKNFAKGEFTCLVCGALGGKKMGKKYKGCLALVQHSVTIAKTKKRRAHRAFGQTVCKVLGWDINDLSTIVSMLSDKPGETQESSIAVVDNVVSVEGKNDEAVPQRSEGGDMQNSLTCADDDADKSSKDVGMVHEVEEPAAKGLTNSSFTSTDADKSLKELGIVTVHEPATEGLPSPNNSPTCSEADQNLENIGIVHPHHSEKPESEGSTIVPLIENNFAGNEVQDRKDE